MIITHETLLNKIEELTLMGDGKPIDLAIIFQYFKCPVADMVVLLYELEKKQLVKLNIPNLKYRSKGKPKGEVILL